jgi:hypothetical protein
MIIGVKVQEKMDMIKEWYDISSLAGGDFLEHEQ